MVPYVVGLIAVVVVVVGLVSSVRSMMSGEGHYGIIEAYVGFVRHGKTMLAVQDCIGLARARNAILASNIGIYAPGVETALIGITDDGLDLDALMVLALQCRESGRGLVLLIDEAGIVMPARQWQTFPVSLMWLLQQSGKLMVEVRYTVQHPMFADSILRSLTAVVHNVRCTPPPSIGRRQAGNVLDTLLGSGAISGWRLPVARLRRRLLRPWFLTVTTTVPGDFGTSEIERVLWRRRVRYRMAWEGSYDTDAAVLPAGRLKGAAQFMERLEEAKRQAAEERPSELDPRLEAQLDGLPHGQREAVREAIRDAGPAA